MKTRTGLIAMGVGMLILGWAAAGQAAMLTWVMEGTIQTVNDPLGLIGFAQEGGRVRYTFTFDSNAPNISYPPSPDGGLYAGLGADLVAGYQAIPAQMPTIAIRRNTYQHQNDAFEVYSWIDVNGMPGSAFFTLHDYSGTALPSSALPQVPYPLTDFGWVEFTVGVIGPPSPNAPSGTPLSFNGSIDSFYAAPAEPSSLALLGLAGLVMGRRRVR